MQPMQRLLRSTFAALTLALVSAPGFAQDSAASAAQWGLLGSWARDCSQPPTNTNGYITYLVKADGSVAYLRDIGEQKEEFPIEMVSILGDGNVKIRMAMPSYNQVREFVLRKGVDGRRQVVWHMQVGGDYSVRDTRTVSSGPEMPCHTPCP